MIKRTNAEIALDNLMRLIENVESEAPPLIIQDLTELILHHYTKAHYAGQIVENPEFRKMFQEKIRNTFEAVSTTKIVELEEENKRLKLLLSLKK